MRFLPRPTPRAAARYVVRRSLSKSGANYSTARGLSLLVLPWRRKQK